MDLIKTRHSIRKYTDQQIQRADLEQILEAGNYAPNAGGGQRSMMENMVLQATELGIASCIISRGYETFDSEEGQKLMKKWDVPEGYACQGFVILGYIDGEQPQGKPRKPGRIRIVEA